jgi:hypothetical protein
MVASQTGELNVVPLTDDSTAQPLDLALSGDWDGPLRSLVAIDALDLCAVVQDRRLSLVDVHTRLLVHQFQVPDMVPGSLRVLHSSPRRCQLCHALAVHTFALSFTLEDRRACAVHSFSLKSDDYNSNICLRPISDDHSTCQTFRLATASHHDVPNPGTWESTNDDMLIGVRRAKPAAQPTTDQQRRSPPATATSTALPAAANTLSPLIRQSLRAPTRGTPPSPHRTPAPWQIWTLSTATGELSTLPLSVNSGARDNLRAAGSKPPVLYAADAGPVARLGKRTVGVALGNALMLVTAGGERIEEAEEGGLVGVERGRGARGRRMGVGAKKRKK